MAGSERLAAEVYEHVRFATARFAEISSLAGFGYDPCPLQRGSPNVARLVYRRAGVEGPQT